MKINKNKLTVFIAVVTVLTMMIGALAFFTDRVDAEASAKTASVKDIIDVTPDPEGDPEGKKDPEDALEAVWEKTNNGDTTVVPGDAFDLGYDLKNIGTEDIDVKETIVLTVKDASKANLNQNAESPEFRLFKETDEDDYGAIEGILGDLNITSVEKISANQIRYTLAGFKLAKGATVSKDYTLVFDKYASNAFQGATCTVDYLVEMRQHVEGIDPNSGWEDIQNNATTMTFEGQTILAVPAA